MQRGATMKYVLEYTYRDGGSAAENEADAKRAQQLLAKFEPSVDVLQWVDRIDGEGGFSVFESDDPVAMHRDIEIWATMLRFALHPVLDIADAVPAQQEAIEFRDSIS
jgi:Protein of unknown function (DUF3303)